MRTGKGNMEAYMGKMLEGGRSKKKEKECSQEVVERILGEEGKGEEWMKEMQRTREGGK